MITLFKIVAWLFVLAVAVAASILVGAVALGVLIWRHYHPHPKAVEPPKVVYFVAVDQRDSQL